MIDHHTHVCHRMKAAQATNQSNRGFDFRPSHELPMWIRRGGTRCFVRVVSSSCWPWLASSRSFGFPDMTIEIKDRWTGKVLFTAKGATTIAAAVTMAVAAGVNLDGANLDGANLDGANLDGASLDGASFIGANFNRANLNRASLIGANFYGANFCGANLTRANFYGANLDGANLYGANLKNVKGLAYQIPQEGELIVWKAVAGGVCKLRVPPEAKRTATPIGRKCRAEWVEVLEAPANGRGLHDTNVIYRAGEIVRPDKYDPDPRVECTHGIHFFLTKEEAEALK